MRKSPFTEPRIVAVLHEWGAGGEDENLVRHCAVTAQTLYRPKKKYGGMQVVAAKRPRAREEEDR